MKKTLILIISFALGHTLFAQPHQSPVLVNAIKAVPDRTYGNHDPYEVPLIHDTKAPKGYQPFYISHYGRHGSRSAWGGPLYQTFPEALAKAKAAGLLTASGDSLMNDVNTIVTLHDGMDGRLTKLGFKEHHGIANRMYHRYPRVFQKGSKRVVAMSSTVQRCIISMTAFTNELSALDPSLDIFCDTGETILAYISNGAPDTVSRAARKLLKQLNDRVVTDTLYTAEMVFNDVDAARKVTGLSMAAIQGIVYSFASIAGSFEIGHDMFHYLPFDFLYKACEHTNMDIYLRQANSLELGDERMVTTVPLIKDILVRADSALEKGDVAADLRFGHDFPFVAMCSFLGIEGIGDRMSLEEARYKWFAYENTPFAANLQMIFYKNKAGDVLVKFLHNEKETHIIGLQAVTGPYYRWSDVRAQIEHNIHKYER